MKKKSYFTRRNFFQTIMGIGGLFVSKGLTRLSQSNTTDFPHLACNSYTWQVFFRRQNLDFSQSLELGLSQVAASGLDGFEPSITSPDEFRKLTPILKKYNLEMRSIYVNSSLHETAEANRSIQNVVSIAKRAAEFGTKIIVTNPSPIRWGGEENKSDEQLMMQAEALNHLGAQLQGIGLTLAYHNHDIELRNAAREFHHMMLGTEEKLVKLCLDAHWIYRGAGNSNIALFDIITLYGPRIVELHLRQSQNFIWTEVFGEGDVDYASVVEYLRKRHQKPHLVLEQAVEKGSDNTLTPLEAHRKSVIQLRKMFSDL